MSVFASLHPIVTVLLGRSLLAETVRPVQQLEVVGTLMGVGLIAAC